MNSINPIKLMPVEGKIRRLRALGIESGTGRVGLAYRKPEDCSHLRAPPQHVFAEIRPRHKEGDHRPAFV